MNEKIRMSCPTCGAVLQVGKTPGIEKRSLRCPVCKQQSPFTAFKIISDEEMGTQLLTGAANGNQVIGRLTVLSTKEGFQLETGKNIIGRKAKTSKAGFQIACSTNRMSREHIMVEVVRENSGYVHYVSLCKQHVNPTFIGKTQLDYGDVLELKDGMVLRLPGVDLLFEIPDTEGTVFF